MSSSSACASANLRCRPSVRAICVRTSCAAADAARPLRELGAKALLGHRGLVEVPLRVERRRERVARLRRRRKSSWRGSRAGAEQSEAQPRIICDRRRKPRGGRERGRAPRRPRPAAARCSSVGAERVAPVVPRVRAMRWLRATWRSRAARASSPAPRAAGGQHRDAVDGAGRDAQLAAGAQRRQHRVHALRRADDRVDRARVDAQRAADARSPRRCARRRARPGSPQLRSSAMRRATGERRERRDQRVAAGRAAIDRRARGDGFRVRTASVVAAAPALRLRQHRVDRVGERCEVGESRRGFYRALPNAMRVSHGADPCVARWFARLPRRGPCTLCARASSLRPVSARHPPAPAPVIERPLVRGFAAWLGATLLPLAGWKVVLAQPVPERCVVIFYPHTTNWDTPIGLCLKFMTGLSVPLRGQGFAVPGAAPGTAAACAGAGCR